MVPSMPADLLLPLARCLPAFEWPTSSWGPQLLERIAESAWYRAFKGPLAAAAARDVMTACVSSAAALRPRFGRELGASVNRMQGELLELKAEAGARMAAAAAAAARSGVASFPRHDLEQDAAEPAAIEEAVIGTS